MRKINESDFQSFTIHIAKNGVNITFYSALKEVMKEWNNIGAGTLFGNRPDGTRAIIDSK